MEERNATMRHMQPRRRIATLMHASHHAGARSASGASATNLAVVARRTALTLSAVLVRVSPQSLAHLPMVWSKLTPAILMNALEATSAQEVAIKSWQEPLKLADKEFCVEL
jgi:hypothetical protein